MCVSLSSHEQDFQLHVSRSILFVQQFGAHPNQTHGMQTQIRKKKMKKKT
jgi:hypothetical protein